MIFDTHAHLDDEQLSQDAQAIVADAVAHRVTRILSVATDLASSYRCINLAETYDEVYASIGIHPNSCQLSNTNQLRELQQLVDHPKVIAIGETGLDGYWDYAPMSLQRDYFSAQIELSQSSGLPFIVHMRDCQAEMLEQLESSRNGESLHGIMHSFTGDEQAARQCLEWGMYISFAGMVTFKKNEQLRAIAQQIPDDRILVETDAPYLSPHPKRGQRPNTPAMVRFTLQCLAEVRGVSDTEFARQTTRNALRVFGLDSAK